MQEFIELLAIAAGVVFAALVIYGTPVFIVCLIVKLVFF